MISTFVLFESAKYQRKNGVFSKHYRVDSHGKEMPNAGARDSESDIAA